jgi:hypothetical protein
MNITKRAAALTIAPLLLAGAATIGLGGTAEAGTFNPSSPCDSYPHPNNATGVWVFTADVTLRTEPATECSSVPNGVAAAGEHFSIWCFTDNYYGNGWVYGRIGTGSVTGWASLDNLNTIPGEDGYLGPGCS